MLRSLNGYMLLYCALISLTTTIAAGVTTPACPDPYKTEIVYRGAGGRVNEIYHELVSCPNIASLDLDFVWSGCVAPEHPWQFDFRSGDRFPALKKLSL